MATGHQADDMQLVPHAPVALFDDMGRIQGWSPTFADQYAHIKLDLVGCCVADLWPELAERWDEIWNSGASDRHLVVMEVAPAPTPGALPDAVKLEISQFVGWGRRLAKVEIGNSTAARLHVLQQEVLQAMANGMQLVPVLETMCRKVEAMSPGVICSILAVGDNGQLRHVASPGLPMHYSKAIDGSLIGPRGGSCGTAAFRGEPVEVADIATDPLWEGYRHLTLPLGLRACWSRPVKTCEGKVIGVFALYSIEARAPSALERQIMSHCEQLTLIALEQEETRSRAYEHAFIDPLTQLPNMARFQQRLTETISIVGNGVQSVAIIYIGLDGFRQMNELLGYAGGDELLRTVTRRLRGLVREYDAVARVGGDEFAMIFVDQMSPVDVARRARQVMDAIGAPLVIDGQRIRLGVSAGIALGRISVGANEMIEDAVAAMQRAKETGRGNYFFSEQEINAQMHARHRAETDLRTAIDTDQLEVYYQPVFCMERGAVIGAEALVRWNHPQRGLISPAEFIPLAEQSGLIDDLGQWVLRRACTHARSWNNDLTIAVNLSPLQFDNPGLARTVKTILDQTGLASSRLELEVTELVLLRDNAVNTAILDELSDLGISLALDDFGTGYSSLSYLHRFSFDRIKIDHSFVRDITRNGGSLKIVRAIIMLARSLGLDVTAEGVETDEQFAVMRGEGAQHIQGYYIGAPMPVSDFLARAETNRQNFISAA